MRRLTLALCAAGLAASGTASASPADVFGLGARSTSMAGAVSADVTDYSANYYNPSGLAFAEGTDLSIGYMTARHRLELSGTDSKIDPVRGLTGGIVAPGRLGPLRFAFGVGTHLSDERLSRARTIKLEQPRWVLYENRSQLLYLSANLAIRPVDWLSIGGGVAFLAATRGSFGITGTAVVPRGTDPRTVYDSQLRHEVDADLTSIRYPEAGITIKPNEQLSFAFTWREKAQIELEIDARLEGQIDASLLTLPTLYELESRTINAFIPRQFVLGTSYHPIERLHLNLDVTYVQWSSYQSPLSSTTTRLDVQAPANFIELPPSPKPSAITPAGFDDRVVPRLGVEYRLGVTPHFDLPLRAGYLYEHTPVRDQSGATNYVDNDRHVLSLGSGFIWNDPAAFLPGNLRFDAFLQWSILPERVTLKDNPADYTGDYRSKGEILAMGANISLGFH